MRAASRLSAAAAAVTAAFATWSFFFGVAPHFRRWLVLISVPPIFASLVQARQYKRSNAENAFWPVAIYLFFIAFYLFAALGLFFFGAILQTAAWVLGRRARTLAVGASAVRTHT